MRETIQGLWIGSALSTMEALSIASFLHHGHPYHLYVYGDVANVPPGATVLQGSEILPDSMIFKYQGHPSYAGFSNFFRYKLLLERGGWWSDTDSVCLRPLDFDAEHVFSTEAVRGEAVINCGMIKAPAGSPVMAHAWDVCRSKETDRLSWGEVGPRLMGEAVRRNALEGCAVPPRVFCPLAYDEWEQALDPECDPTFGADTLAVHLWNEMWRRQGHDKDRGYHPSCLYERLKKRYLRLR